LYRHPAAFAVLVVLGNKEWPDRVEVVACYRDAKAVCPRCGRSTWQVHQ
jgi:hypothetical protein